MLNVVSIGLHTSLSSGGGADRYFSDLSSVLNKMDGVEQKAFALLSANNERVFKVNDVLVPYGSTSEPILRRWKGLQRAAAPCLGRENTLVATHFALYGFPLRKSLRKCPHVVHFHGPWAAESQLAGETFWTVSLKKRLENLFYLTADHFIVLSEAFQKILVHDYGIAESKISTIPGGVFCGSYDIKLDKQEARARMGVSKDTAIILSVRRLTRRTGILELVKAFAAVKKEREDAVLLIAGTGPLRDEIAALIAENNLAHQVKLLGIISDKKLALAYRAADLSVVPSQALEGFGLVALESLASGTPALVTPIGGLPSTVEGLDRGLVLGGCDVKHIEQGLREVLTNKRPLPTSKACKEHVRRHFDWNVIAPRILKVYERTLREFTTG